MKISKTWKTVQKAVNELGIEKETLFKYRDDGTLKLGPHFLAFSDTYSRDSYRWNVNAVKKHLASKGLLAA
jgi:hypothetical protein